MRLKGVSILVVEDEVDLREIIAEILMSEGAVVSQAENGNRAFALLQKNDFDVVISDVRMPGGDGVDLLHCIDKNIPLKPKIFLCSGYNDLSPGDATKLGVIEMFSKPFNLTSMITSIARSVA